MRPKELYRYEKEQSFEKHSDFMWKDSFPHLKASPEGQRPPGILSGKGDCGVSFSCSHSKPVGAILSPNKTVLDI